MTDVTPKSHDLRMEDLSPMQQAFVRRGIEINRQGREFCVKDFADMEPDLFRKYVERLRNTGWIITTMRGRFAWHRIKGEYTGKENRKVTLEGMGVGANMQSIINEASVQIPAMHDIKITFSSPDLYQNLLKKGAKPHPKNKGIYLTKISLARYIDAKITVYPQKTIVEISCTYNPIIYDIKGAQEFIGHVESIKMYLTKEFDATDMPDSLDWIAVHYHINQDGQTEFSDPTFHRTIADITGGLIRVYAKQFPDGKTRLRMERIITPNCTLAKVVGDMTSINNYLHSDNDNISHLMPSQILGLNRFADIIAKMSAMYNPSYEGVSSF